MRPVIRRMSRMAADAIEERPFVRGGFTDVYKATYNRQPVVSKVLKTAYTGNLENVYRTSGLVLCKTIRSVYVIFSALCERGRGMEAVASV